jgi:hypothetical protein
MSHDRDRVPASPVIPLFVFDGEANFGQKISLMTVQQSKSSLPKVTLHQSFYFCKFFL